LRTTTNIIILYSMLKILYCTVQYYSLSIHVLHVSG